MYFWTPQSSLRWYIYWFSIYISCALLFVLLYMYQQISLESGTDWASICLSRRRLQKPVSVPWGPLHWYPRVSKLPGIPMLRQSKCDFPKTFCLSHQKLIVLVLKAISLAGIVAENPSAVGALGLVPCSASKRRQPTTTNWKVALSHIGYNQKNYLSSLSKASASSETWPGLKICRG